MSTALRSPGLLDVLCYACGALSRARLVSMPVCAASLRNPVRLGSGSAWRTAPLFFA